MKQPKHLLAWNPSAVTISPAHVEALGKAFCSIQTLSTVCNPNGATYAGMVSAGQNRRLTVQGQWKPGEGHPYWGPTGDSNTKFNGMNKWSAVYIVTDFFNNLLYYGQYAGNSVNIPGSASPAVHVYIKMNDDKYDDNVNHPNDPMSCQLV